MPKYYCNITLEDGVDTDQPPKASEVVRSDVLSEGCSRNGALPTDWFGGLARSMFSSPVITPSPGKSVKVSLDEAIEYEARYGASIPDHLILDI